MYLKAILFSFLVTSLLAGVIGAKKGGHGAQWGYGGKIGPEHWAEHYSKCGGNRQSPIDIKTKDLVTDESLKKLSFMGYETPIKDAKIKNNGHTVQLMDEDTEATISGGGLPGTYKFKQLHFHWGGDSSKGSEHTIDGVSSPLEMHLVHANKRYSSKDATNHGDGLAVLAILFEISDKDNEELKPLIDSLDEIVNENDEFTLGEDFDIDQLIPDDTLPYYRYEGSLTTPDCAEAVIWTIFKHKQQISEKQLDQFRALQETGDGDADSQMEDNFRPTQPLHNRKVKISSDTGDEDDPDPDDDDDDDDDKDGNNAANEIVPSTMLIFGLIAGAVHNIFYYIVSPLLSFYIPCI